MLRSSHRIPIFILFFVMLILTNAIMAVPPSPELVQKWKAEGVYQQKIQSWKAAKAKYNIDVPDEILPFPTWEEMSSNSVQKSPAAVTVDTVRVLVILAEFPDYRHTSTSYIIPRDTTADTIGLGSITTTPAMFDSLLFTRRGIDQVSNPTGSMTEFYLENSYGRYFIQGDVTNWLMMPLSYSTYVGDNNGMIMGSTLAGHAVTAAENAGVDFSQYAINSLVPGVIIVHAGPGAETGAYGIWSHKSAVGGDLTYDNVYFTNYTLNPEENGSSISSMGVFSHEWGHILNLPDLYDTGNGPGQGLGDWSLMAGGNWNGGQQNNSGQTPAHFDLYSKSVLQLPYSHEKFLSLTGIDTFLVDAPIPQVESEPVGYAIRGDAGAMQYFLVENRQQVGFDKNIPGNGLCIYHVDFSQPTNALPQSIPYRYRVALEQADGFYNLEKGNNQGDRNDTWPGLKNKREFHDYSLPAARTNTGSPTIEGNKTQVGVWNISNSDSLMTADLEAQYTRPWLTLAGDSIRVVETGNGDSLFIQGESFEVWIEVQNWMGMTFKPIARITASVPGLQYVANDVSLGTALNPINTNFNLDPIIVDIPADFPSSIVTFTLTVTSDKDWRSPGTADFSSEFTFDLAIGEAQILLVDDDAGWTDDNFYLDAFNRLKVPIDHYDLFASGTPAFNDLVQYTSVIWHNGHDRAVTTNPNHLDSNAISTLKQYLDNGGNLMYVSNGASVDSLDRIDSSFMAQYLHAVMTGTTTKTYMRGLSHNTIGGDKFYRMTTGGVAWTRKSALISPVNGGDSCFAGSSFDQLQSNYSTGVTFAGTYKTVFLSFPAEFINEGDPTAFTTKDTLLQRVMDFFNDRSVTAIDDDYNNSDLLPTNFTLEQNYPNPFNPTTNIEYNIASGKAEEVELVIFNMLGRRVKTLVNNVQPPGRYQVIWDGKTDSGYKAASGVYLYRLKRGGEALTKKMLLLK